MLSEIVNILAGVAILLFWVLTIVFMIGVIVFVLMSVGGMI